MCCDFQTATPETAPLDPHKRVRHFAGLVLGPEEFLQDQLYFMERDRLPQRALHGYGTVLGLGVRVRDNASGRPEVLVDPGLAVTPRGESVCVSRAQCADLDGWLAVHAGELTGAAGSPPGSPPSFGSPGSPPSALTLWVLLCARECATDLVPVLGDPCRTAADATAPSRIADDFELKLALTPPEHIEEAAVRLLAGLLRMIDISGSGGPLLSPADIAALVRAMAPAGSPGVLPTLADLLAAASPPLTLSSPAGPLFVHPNDAHAAFQAAWREWIAFVRPQLAAAAGCANNGENCVLLAQIDFSITGAGAGLQVDGPVAVDDVNRPWLLQTRLLQELSLTGWMANDLTA